MRSLRTPTLNRASIAGFSLALVLSIGTHVWAQGRQTGTLRGSVKDSTDVILSGVSVTVVSAALQGSRSTVTDLNGIYEIIGLPPGHYNTSFTLQDFTRVDNQVTVPLGTTVEVHVTMQVGAVAEEVNVAAVLPTPLTSTEISQNLEHSQVQRLPMGRSPFRIAELAPGLTANTPNRGQIAINGAFAYDNIYLIDGVDINDNLFAAANNLFIEDAVEESQVLTSGISAEYGRFSGGVVNVITKSGGNRFSGSFRANMYKPDWTSRTPFEIENDNERTGSIADNATYETTVGGSVVDDRLWFFYANRRQRESSDTTFPVSGISYVAAEENDRNLIKLTGTLTQGHTLAGSYMRNSTSADRPAFPFSIDPVTLVNPKTPNDLWVATYRGAVSSSLFVEGQVSRKSGGSGTEAARRRTSSTRRSSRLPRGWATTTRPFSTRPTPRTGTTGRSRRARPIFCRPGRAHTVSRAASSTSRRPGPPPTRSPRPALCSSRRTWKTRPAHPCSMRTVGSSRLLGRILGTLCSCLTFRWMCCRQST